MRPPFELSRRGAKRAMEAGGVVVEGASVAVASRPVTPGTRVTLVSEDVSLPILHLGADFVVIDKPPVMPSQIPADTDAIAASEILAAQLRRAGDRRPVKIVHRLDTNTTGVMVYALGDEAAARIAGKLQSRESKKTYVALVSGRLEHERTIEAPIARTGAREFGVRDEGRPARTLVRPLQSSDDVSLVEATLLTGRTHQLRIHLAWAGHPILGDRKYGGPVADAAPRPMLHALRLEIPGEGEWLAPLHPDMRGVIRSLGMEYDDGV